MHLKTLRATVPQVACLSVLSHSSRKLWDVSNSHPWLVRHQPSQRLYVWALSLKVDEPGQLRHTNHWCHRHMIGRTVLEKRPPHQASILQRDVRWTVIQSVVRWPLKIESIHLSALILEPSGCNQGSRGTSVWPQLKSHTNEIWKLWCRVFLCLSFYSGNSWNRGFHSFQLIPTIMEREEGRKTRDKGLGEVYGAADKS